MAELALPDRWTRRSAAYSYLRPILAGRRVLELGCGSGEGTAYLARLGVRSVVGAGDAGEVARARTAQREAALSFSVLTQSSLEAAGPFDVVVVPEAASLFQNRGPLPLAAVLRLVAEAGELVCIVPNGDLENGPGEAGVPYFDVLDQLSPHFARVRMFGQTPFAAFGIAEFDEAPTELRVEPDPALAETDEPTNYIAVAGPDDLASLGYALVQIPTSSFAGEPSLAALPAEGAEAGVGELRRKLAESLGQAEGLLRVTRAQSEELEELRARVRRTAESKAELDEEVRRLRRALLEADESVVKLTRKTTEDMTALAQRLTTGLRGADRVPAADLADELRRREAELAERESGLSERDERIAALEAARQEAAWRADAAEDEVGRLRAEVAALREAPGTAPVNGPERQELLATLKLRDQALEEYQRAAAAHLDEAGRLRDAINEQSSLVAELEEDLARAEKRLGEVLEENERLRRSIAEIEEADRQRRSRLAELEGQMMRIERAQAAAPPEAERARAAAAPEAGVARAETAPEAGVARAEGGAEEQKLRAEIAASQAEVAELRAQIAEAERRLADSLRLRDETERARKLIATRLEELEAQVQQAEAAAAHLAELRAEAPDPEETYERLAAVQAQHEATMLAAARVPELEAELAATRARVAELEGR